MLVKARLEDVPGVTSVSWEKEKPPGGHFMTQNLVVHSELYKKPFVFELTRKSNPSAHNLLVVLRCLFWLCMLGDLM